MADHEAGLTGTGARTGGLGYAHAMPPSPAPPRQPRKEATILLRWRSRWEAPSLVSSKLAADPPEEFSLYKLRYRRHIDTLLRAGIAWTSITRGDLDSPLQNGVEFDRALCLAIERRRSNMGRAKKIKKGKI